MALLTHAQQRQVEEAVTRAEQHTDAEIVTVLAPRADDYSYIPLLWASLIALLVPALAHFFIGGIQIYSLLMLQWASFVFLSLIFRIPAITTRLIPPRVRHWRASNLARRQFLEQKLHHTQDRTGVLIFVSEAELMSKSWWMKGFHAIWTIATGAASSVISRVGWVWVIPPKVLLPALRPARNCWRNTSPKPNRVINCRIGW